MGVAKPAPTPNTRPGATGAQARTGSSVVLAFVPFEERALAGTPGMSIGILSATQGAFVREQMLLDIGQGARIASSAYKPSYPPVLSLLAQGGAAQISGWQAALHRADDAPQLLQPGLLASSLAGGVGYAGVAGANGLGALAAADRRGHIASVSLGSSATLLARIAALRARQRLVVADLPGGAAGIAELHALAAERPAGELLIAVQRAPDSHGHELLWAGVAGLPGGGGRELTSRTTNQRGLLSAIDIAPTILDYLGLRVPNEMRGEPIETHGPLDSAVLRSLMARLHVVGGRRLKAFGVLLCAWAALLLAAALLDSILGASRDGMAGRGERRNRPARAWAMRVGALAVLWAPTAVLVTAAVEPSAGVEYAAIALLCLGLGALSDVLLPWPRAPLAPAVVSVLALVIDALAGTQLLIRSLLGPNPILGARFYGFGNELKSGLAVLVLGAVAAVAVPRRALAARRPRDGRRRHRARRDRGLRADRRRRRWRDPRRRRRRRRHDRAAARRLLAPTRAARRLRPPARARIARRDRPAHGARLRPLHRQHPARPLRRRPARRARAPLHRRLARAEEPRDALRHGARARLRRGRRAHARAAARARRRRSRLGGRRSAAG